MRPHWVTWPNPIRRGNILLWWKWQINSEYIWTIISYIITSILSHQQRKNFLYANIITNIWHLPMFTFCQPNGHKVVLIYISTIIVGWSWVFLHVFINYLGSSSCELPIIRWTFLNWAFYIFLLIYRNSLYNVDINFQFILDIAFSSPILSPMC